VHKAFAPASAVDSEITDGNATVNWTASLANLKKRYTESIARHGLPASLLSYFRHPRMNHVYTPLSGEINSAYAVYEVVPHMEMPAQPLPQTESREEGKISVNRVLHPVFKRFSPWEGLCPEGCKADWLGRITREYYHNPDLPEMHLSLRELPAHQVKPALPLEMNEEYFEHIACLTAVAEAKESFAMYELGARYGRWSVMAACAMRRLGKSLPVRLTCVEAEPDHFTTLQEHFTDNGLKPAEHRLIRAVATSYDGEAYFTVGRHREWRWQHMLSDRQYAAGEWGTSIKRENIKRLPAVSLATLLEGDERVDLIDMDIQNAEWHTVQAASALLDSRVRRVYIGTHSRFVENGLRNVFSSLGWFNVYDYPGLSNWVVRPGIRVAFQDGVQYWINPRLVAGIPDGARVYPFYFSEKERSSLENA
jgi:FkbM family methyltransferase